MERSKILLSLALVLVTGTSGAVIWHQQTRIEALSVEGADKDRERKHLRSRLVVAEQQIEAAAKPDIAAQPESPPTTASLPQGDSGPEREGIEARGASMMAELLNDPEFAPLLLSQRKIALDSRYSALFRQLGLEPQEIESLKSLLAERQLSRMEAGMMARTDGLGRDDRDTMREIVRESDNEVDAAIRGLLGEDKFETLKKYERSAAERQKVDQISHRLSYSSAPLQQYQADSLVKIYSSLDTPRSPGRRATPEESAAYLAARRTYDTEVQIQAQRVLNPVQLESLRQMQKEQADADQLNAMMSSRMRQMFQGRGRPGPGG